MIADTLLLCPNTNPIRKKPMRVAQGAETVAYFVKDERGRLGLKHKPAGNPLAPDGVPSCTIQRLRDVVDRYCTLARLSAAERDVLKAYVNRDWTVQGKKKAMAWPTNMELAEETKLYIGTVRKVKSKLEGRGVLILLNGEGGFIGAAMAVNYWLMFDLVAQDKKAEAERAASTNKLPPKGHPPCPQMGASKLWDPLRESSTPSESPRITTLARGADAASAQGSDLGTDPDSKPEVGEVAVSTDAPVGSTPLHLFQPSPNCPLVDRTEEPPTLSDLSVGDAPPQYTLNTQWVEEETQARYANDLEKAWLRGCEPYLRKMDPHRHGMLAWRSVVTNLLNDKSPWQGPGTSALWSDFLYPLLQTLSRGDFAENFTLFLAAFQEEYPRLNKRLDTGEAFWLNQKQLAARICRITRPEPEDVFCEVPAVETRMARASREYIRLFHQSDFGQTQSHGPDIDWDMGRMPVIGLKLLYWEKPTASWETLAGQWLTVMESLGFCFDATAPWSLLENLKDRSTTCVFHVTSLPLGFVADVPEWKEWEEIMVTGVG